MKKGIIIGGIILIIAGIFGLGWFSRPIYDAKQLDGASTQAGTYIKDILAGKPADAYNLTTQSLKDGQPLSKFVSEMKDLKSNNPSYGKASVFKAQDGTVIYVQMIENLPATTKGRTNGLFTVVLTNQGGWKVNSATVN